MVVVVFTLDYEIWGNGTGSIQELVLEPTERLIGIFREFHAPLVVFVEALEFLKMEEFRADPAVRAVPVQLQRLRDKGHEIGLHLHAWWANAKHVGGRWLLDYKVENLCTLGDSQLSQVVLQGLDYMRRSLDDGEFRPASFRSGQLLMQPTRPLAQVLESCGIFIDSSLCKGWYSRVKGVDYRPAARNGWYWRFRDDVNKPDPAGRLVELPIYTELVPIWKMLNWRRLFLAGKRPGLRGSGRLGHDFADFFRLRVPRKLDFCKMGFAQMKGAIENVLRLDRDSPGVLKPVVAIGHSKELVDFGPVTGLLKWLVARSIPVTTLDWVGSRIEISSAPIS